MNNKGFSLIEALVSLVIGAIVIASAISFMINVTRIATFNNIRGELNDEARVIETLVSRDIRMAGYQTPDSALEISEHGLVSRYIRGGVLNTIEYEFVNNRLTRSNTVFGSHLTSFDVTTSVVDSDTVGVWVFYSLEKAGVRRNYAFTVYPRNLNLN